MPQGDRFYYRHSAKVVDGTRCNDESFDVCVDGQCQPVGCDLMLGSQAREDKCRECRGNGTNCNTYSSLIDSQDFRNGYNDVLLIPKDATNILISEVRASNNYLALRDRDTGKYYLNGDYHIDFPRSLEIAGAVWKYERSQQGFAAPDILHCLGPINEDLYLSLLQQEPNVGIQYEYSLPSSRRPPPSTQYSWAFDEFSACSASCGGGTQTRNVSCHDADTLEEADESLCDTALRPATSQTCNTQPCAPHWVEGAWSPCSKPCGEGGMRSRQVHCEKVVNNGYPAVVSDKECFDLLGPKPELFQECGKDAACPSWFTGPWKPCDKLCGPGKQTRQVVCHQKINGRVQVFDDQQCTEEKPSAEQPCELHPCEGVDWVASDWGGCDTCLSKVRTRTIRCSTKGNSIVDDRFCVEHEKPVAEEDCDLTKLPPCTVQWYATQWSNCSVECGKGIQSRRVFCGLFDGSVVRSVEDARCENETKYPDTKPCEMPEDKCPAKWFAGPWSECTKKCGGGEQFRHVACLLNNETSHNCDGTAVLDSTRSCNQHECDEDQTLPLDAKTTPIMDEDYDEDCEEEDEEGDPSTDEEEGLTGTTPEDMMLSDSPSTFEGSGTGSTVSDTESTEDGSGEITLSTLDEGSGSESTSESSSTESTESTVSEETETTETGASSGSTETEETGSTETTESTVSGPTEESTSEGSTESSSESSGSTEVSASSSESETSGSTEESTTSSATAESGSTETETTDESTTETATTESTETTETSSTETTETGSTETTETGNTETTETGSTETTEETGSTETTEETGSTETTEETGSTETTEETGSTETTEETGSTETTESGSTTESGTTETGSTETSVSGSTETTELTASEGSTTESVTESGSTEETGSTETTESGATETTESGATETTESGATETTESGATETETGSTETTSEGSTEFSSTEESTTEESTPWDWSTTFSVTKKQCKPRKKPACSKAKFGCCADKRTAAAGPFEEGCPVPATCKESKFGCCPDGVSAAWGPKDKGCPITRCNETLYGCCKSDNKTAAQGNDQEGCPPPPPACKSSKFGCCKDGKTEAKGPKKQGCPETQKPKGCASSKFGCCHDNQTAAEGPKGKGCPCNATEFGCCPDGVSTAEGPKLKGCEMSCNGSAYGCCPDNQTPAHGPDYEGCCLAYPYGCCPDNFKPAEGPHLEGCSCQESHYGCCPDNITIARGPNNQGCGCQYSQHGCCPDRHTDASGPDYEGCGCHTYQFGCCPDGVTIVKGPNLQGCHCRDSQYGCCGDEQTPAQGPNQQGCDCAASKYGCCPDGQTEAKGEKFFNCTDVPDNKQAVCALPSERGPCRNYSVYWFYDTEYGGCSRFWYGGCEGNGNRFTSQQECEDVCVQPAPKDACKLPKVKGACTGYNLHWYYDSEREHCGQFLYGGCLGNANNFDSRDKCVEQCEPARSDDVCKLPIEAGSCAGNYPRWGYNHETGNCDQFSWGGCEGNGNRFISQAACVQRCNPPGALKLPDTCTLPAEIGDCANYREKWFYDTAQKRCRQFYYGGCGGNGNNFNSEQECEARCAERETILTTTTVTPAQQQPGSNVDFCFEDKDPGPCTQFEPRWAYDAALGSCTTFQFGGCGGNRNNFPSEEYCQYYCQGAQDVCQLPMRVGPCTESVTSWFYDASSDACSQFTYGGCDGNGNRFESREACQSRCRSEPALTTTTRAPTPPPAPAADRCQQPQETGDCRGYFIKWYYDYERDACGQFVYGGCGGNDNKFETQEECEGACQQRRPPPIITTTTTLAPVEPEECRLPTSLQPCGDNETVYYYNSQNSACEAAPIGGCRYANSYRTEEECERICGVFRGLEVCKYGVDPGPCRGAFPKYYYDPVLNICDQFMYGGCQGGPNRFSAQDECEAVCNVPPESGNEVVQDCDRYVSECESIRCSTSVQRTKTPEGCIKCACVPQAVDCDILAQECASLKCTYGVRNTTGEDGCVRCRCIDHPCADKECPEGQRCVASAYRDPISQETQYSADCHIVNKEGSCPADDYNSLEVSSGGCRRECNDDADCRGVGKCCQRGCSQLCLEPPSQTSAPRTTTYTPELPQAPQANPETEPEVTAELGGKATLRCLFHGNPKPKITWRRGEITLDGQAGRYRVLGDGALEIFSLYANDSGVYICVADNGLGISRQEIHLVVNVPVSTNINWDLGTVSAGSVLSLPCEVDGYPVPEVYWTKDSVRLLGSDRMQITDSRLTINGVTIEDSGVYGCHARNSFSSHESTVQVNVQGMYIPSSCTDNPYFANCQLIVKSKFCRHPYYSGFCCKSCVESGQLDPQDIPMQADMPYKRRK